MKSADWKIDVVKNGCDVLQELVELLQEQNRCQEKATVHELDAATQTDPRHAETGHFAENDVLQDAATQTIDNQDVKSRLMIDRLTVPVSEIKEQMSHPGIDSDVNSSLQRHIRKNAALFLILSVQRSTRWLEGINE